MLTRIIGATIVSVGLCALSSAAYAQGTSGTTQDKNANAPAASSDNTSAKTTRHHAKRTSHHHGHASGMHDGTSGMGGMHPGMHDQDSAYHGALKRCVQGPEAQRDSCLDQAIAQYGHR